ncbi:MAG: membrane dipeptidase [Niameybacter sp.]|uniref:dipeptidase n=1 Tax=Niameybacter sp. TaxID=2033640 RepID=UPI002FCA56AA
MSYIDLHCDTASLILANKTELAHNDYHVDIQKMKASHYLAQWFAFFLVMKQDGAGDLFGEFQEMYDYFIQEVKKNEKDIAIARTYADYMRCKEENKVAAFLSLEEGEVIAKLENPIETLTEMGITLMTLTWNYENSLGAPHSINKGLTQKGKSIVEGLNHAPILLDISHLSEAALPDIVDLYKKPIIASHSNARGYCNESRNVTDEGLRIIAQSGGLVGTNFFSEFLNQSQNSTVDDLIGNIQYIYNQVGEDVLALGTDFDGISCNLEVCNCKEMDRLRSSMTRLFNSRIIDKICYGNAERIIRENF